MGVAHDLILLGASFYSIIAPQSSDINSSQLWDAIGMRARMESQRTRAPTTTRRRHMPTASRKKKTRRRGERLGKKLGRRGGKHWKAYSSGTFGCGCKVPDRQVVGGSGNDTSRLIRRSRGVIEE